MSEDLTTETDLDAAPENVWRALTEPDLVETWLAPSEVTPEQGGPIRTEVLEADPPNHLRIAWRGKGLDSEVTFTVTERPGGSRLTVVHRQLAGQRVQAAPLKMAA